MLQHHVVPIVIAVWRYLVFQIVPGEEHIALSGCQDGGARRVEKFHTGMEIALALIAGAETVRGVDLFAVVYADRALHWESA